MSKTIGLEDYANTPIQKSMEATYGLSKAENKKVKKVMDEWKTGKLHSGSKKGPEVTDQKQAIAIALSEAGLSKAGEGSRGGHVIGHTKSGDPVYTGKTKSGKEYDLRHDMDHETNAKHYDSFSSDDRREVGEAHKKLVVEHGHKMTADQVNRHAGEARHIGAEMGDKKIKYGGVGAGKTAIKKAIDDNYANGLIDPLTYMRACVQLDNLLEKAGKTGEGSRGGHVIGHTKSGKAIYDHFGHPEHNGFTADESREAALHHIESGKLHEQRENMYNTLHGESKTDEEKKHTKEGAETHAKAKQHHYINADIHHEHANMMDAAKNKEHLKNKLEGKHGFIGFTHKGERVEVYANSQYDAIKQIREKHKVPKSKEHLVHAHLAEKNVDPQTGKGEQVYHNSATYFD